MQSRYSAKDASAMIAHYGDVPSEVALRVYTSRLIGNEISLVLHGGGNTSAKGKHRTLLGDEVDCLWVKGSGSSLDRVTPKDLPALDLAYLRRLRGLERLTDEEMVNQLRTHLFDASAPNPSVEALLHAFLPQRFVDHSHADAVLAITNREHGEQYIREALGDRVSYLPYIMPGFPLAKAVADAYEARPDVSGIVLGLHGLFSFGDSAEESYERHIQLVDACEGYLAKRSTPLVSVPASIAHAPIYARLSALLPTLRGALALRFADGEDLGRFVAEVRCTPETVAFASDARASRWAASGPLTPDHVIRTKAQPLVIDQEGDPKATLQQVSRYREDYAAYFTRCSSSRNVTPTQLDASPRVVLIPGAGLVCFGRTKKDAVIAADLYERTIATKLRGSDLGAYQGLGELDLFDMEYWSLEQAKLGKAKPRALEGQVAWVTGAAGAIGRGICEELCAEGACVVLVDHNVAELQAAGDALEKRFGQHSVACVVADVTDDAAVEAAFAQTIRRYGGVDIVVPNAGAALVKPIEQLSSAEARRLCDVNYGGVLNAIRSAARVFREQATGGAVIINSSKNVFAPGKDFAGYSASKAAAHQLGKVAAIELAPLGVRVNMINADAVFSHGATASGLWAEVGPERAKSRGLSAEQLQDFYRERNLLKARVTATHVGRAVVFFATQQTPTTGATLPVDGGVTEAFPR